MNRKIFKNLLLTIGFIFAIFLFSNSVQAAYINISLSSTSANPGEQITGNVTSDCVGRVNLSVSNGSISTDRVWIEGGAQSFTVTVGTAGTTSINATAEGGKMSSGGADVDVPGASATVSVSAPPSGGNEQTPPADNPSGGETGGGTTNNGNPSTSNETQTPSQPTTTPQPENKSNNTNLSNLGITPNDFTGFKPYVTEYTTSVPNDVTTINVYATAQKGQTVTGTGNKELQEGENVFKIVVTAEDGKTQKTYTLTVNRETADETEENPEEGETELTESFGLASLEIEDIELTPEFSTDIYEYTAKYTGDDTQLNITTRPTEEGTNVEITGNENLVDGENIITILVTDSSGDKTVTYQINVQKEKAEEALLDTNQEELENQNKTRNLIIIVGIIVLILIVAIVLIIRHKRNKRWEEEYAGEPYEEDDYNEENPYNNNNYDNSYDDYDNEESEQGNTEFKKLTQKLVKRENKPETNINLEEEHEHKDSKQKIKDLYLKQYSDEDNLDDDIETRRRSRGKRFK